MSDNDTKHVARIEKVGMLFISFVILLRIIKLSVKHAAIRLINMKDFIFEDDL